MRKNYWIKFTNENITSTFKLMTLDGVITSIPSMYGGFIGRKIEEFEEWIRTVKTEVKLEEIPQ